MSTAAPAVATMGSADPSAPLIVLLHGRGSHEREIIGLAGHLEQVHVRLAALPGVTTRQSAISVPGARGFMLAPPRLGPTDAFIVPSVGEFAHLHPGHDGSLHLALPPRLAADVVIKGWGVMHPLAGVRLTPGMVMLFGPRNTTEVETVVGVVTTSYGWASGGLR